MRDSSCPSQEVLPTTVGLAGLAYKHWFILVSLTLMIASSLTLLWFTIASSDQLIQGDLYLYQHVVSDLFAGKLPYRDRVLEYPPYAILIFLLPRIFGGILYPSGFMSLALLADWLVKVLLLIVGLRRPNSFRGLLPLITYCLAIPFTGFFFASRFDIWPALICMAAIWLFCSNRHALSGLAIAVGIGVKLYPAVFVLPLFVLAARQRKGWRFVAGLTLGLIPIVVLSFFLPWWRFAEFQSARGLQVESLYASILWLAKLLAGAELYWTPCKAWTEVQGPLASVVLPWSRGLFVAVVIISTMLAAWGTKNIKDISIPKLARLLLIPLLGFVAFNQVLSPQFMIWILPLAALGSLEGNPWPMLAVSVATILTPVIFPTFTGNYGWGLNPYETAILVARNLTLVSVWASLIYEVVSFPRKPAQDSQSL